MELLFIKLFSDTDIFILLCMFYTGAYLITSLVSIGFVIYLFSKFKQLKPLAKIGWGIVQWFMAYLIGSLIMIPFFVFEAFVLHGKGDETMLLYIFLAVLSFVAAHYITIRRVLNKLQTKSNQIP